MASQLSLYVAEALMNWMKGTPMPTAPVSLWVNFWLGNPGDDGLGSFDITMFLAGVARIEVTFGTVSSPTYRVMSNDAMVDFGNALNDCPGVTWFGVWDDPAAGHLIGVAPLTTPKNYLTGDPVNFPIGALAVSFA